MELSLEKRVFLKIMICKQTSHWYVNWGLIINIASSSTNISFLPALSLSLFYCRYFEHTLNIRKCTVILTVYICNMFSLSRPFIFIVRLIVELHVYRKLRKVKQMFNKLKVSRYCTYHCLKTATDLKLLSEVIKEFPFYLVILY